MADPPRYPGAPRWVKVSGIIAIVVVLLVVVVLLLGGGPGGHGPGRHTGGGDTQPVEQAVRPDAPADRTPPIEHGG